MKGDFTRNTFRPEKHYASVRMQQGRVQLDADWNEAMDIIDHRTRLEAIDLIGPCGAPEGNAAFGMLVADSPEPKGLSVEAAEKLKALMKKLKQDDFIITPGRYYVGGVLCENDDFLIFSEQAGKPKVSKAGLHVIYLDLWQRHISALDDAGIRETALGGPDTATRVKTEWRIGALQVNDKKNLQAACATDYPEWVKLAGPRKAALAARTQPGKTSSDPCIVAAGAGYRRLENQLYRVEIHDPGAFGKATYKWSRDNGSVALKVDGVTLPNIIEVSAPGRDIQTMVATGQWLELTDEVRELTGEPGGLVKIDQVGDGKLTLSMGSSVLTDFDLKTLRAIRWEGVGEVTGSHLSLESGVEVQFADGAEYRTGDYWLIPARTLTADVEWPQEAGQPQFVAPYGGHLYCKLGLVRRANERMPVQLVADCRPLFSPLAERRFQITDVRIVRGNEPLRFFAELAPADVEEGFQIHCNRLVGNDFTTLNQLCYVEVMVPVVAEAVIYRLVADYLYPRGGTAPVHGFTGLHTDFTAMNRFVAGPGEAAAELPQIPDLGAHAVRLPGTVSVEEGVVHWQGTGAPVALGVYLGALQMLGKPLQLEAKLVVKGNAVRAKGEPELALDGEAYYLGAGGENLRRPTGNGRKGGDFEVFFTIAVTAPK